MEKYKISIDTTNTNNQSIEISLSGELTVSNIDKIKNDILISIKNFKSIHLIVKNIIMIDLSFLQFLLSMKKSEGKLIERFTSEINTEGEFLHLITNAGFKVNI